MKYLMIFGTRPEAIKLYPVWLEMKKQGMDVLAISIGQHKSLLDTTCSDLKFHRDVVRHIYSHPKPPELLRVAMEEISANRPDMVIVQGDTFSTWAGAMGAFLNNVPVAHVEAGIRSGDLKSPYPEEGLRQQISCVTSLHLCPDFQASHNLCEENVLRDTVIVGQTGLSRIPTSLRNLRRQLKLICTLHRRESTYAYQEMICKGIATFLGSHHEYYCVFVRHPSTKYVPQGEGFITISPQSHKEMLDELATSAACITDSGGLQEEAEYLGIPCLVARTVRDRGRSPLAGSAALAISEQLAIMTGPDYALEYDTFPHDEAPARIVKALNDFHGAASPKDHSGT